MAEKEARTEIDVFEVDSIKPMKTRHNIVEWETAPSDTALVQCFQSVPPGLTGLLIPHRTIESPTNIVHLKCVNVIFPLQQTRDIAYELAGPGEVGYGMEPTMDYYFKRQDFSSPVTDPRRIVGSRYLVVVLVDMSIGDAGCEVPSNRSRLIIEAHL